MFDDINSKSSQPSDTGQNIGGNVPKPPEGSGLNISSAPQGKIEDIFAETEKGSGFGVPAPEKIETSQPAKPAVFQPAKPNDVPATPASGGAPSSSKIKFIGLIVLALIFVIAGTWYVYTTTFSPKVNQINTVNNDVDTTSNETTNEVNNEVNNNENNEVEQPVVEQPPTEQPPIIPTIVDTDQDGLTDDEEMQLGTNINSSDTDDDGLFDREEVKTYLTDPLNNDTDGDGYLDGDEVEGGYNPKGAGKLLDINNSIQ